MSVALGIKRILNDNNQRVQAEGQFFIEWHLASSANIFPGIPVYLASGANGELTVTETAGTEANVYGVAEYDPLQIADCTTTYASGALIPIIVLGRSKGYLRNCLLKNPAANINAGVALMAGAVGFALVVEPTLVTESDNMGFQDAGGATPWGTNGATGGVVIPRILGKALYYLANPAADTRIAIEI